MFLLFHLSLSLSFLLSFFFSNDFLFMEFGSSPFSVLLSLCLVAKKNLRNKGFRILLSLTV